MNAFSRNLPLTETQLFSAAPSIFASAPHASRSERYGYFNSIDLIRALVEKGFAVTEARQSKARDESKAGYTKHIVRLRHTESYEALQSTLLSARQSGQGGFIRDHQQALALGVAAEVVLTNSHDGSSAVVLSAGLLRAACFNGLIVADSTIASIHVTHSKRLVANVVDGAFSIAEQAPKALEAVQSWSQLQLSAPEQHAFAKAAHVVRFADSNGDIATAVKPEQLLKVRRGADESNDLWTVYNRVQENAVRGGLDDVRPATEAAKERGRFTPRHLKTRAIKSIDGDVKLNKALWTLGEEFARLKAAA